MIALVAGWLSAAPALAQQSDDEGGLQANVGLHFDLNDNIYDSSTQEIESWIARISPDLLLSSTPGKRQFSAQYVGDYGKFFDSSDDDYEDHSLTGRGCFRWVHEAGWTSRQSSRRATTVVVVAKQRECRRIHPIS